MFNTIHPNRWLFWLVALSAIIILIVWWQSRLFFIEEEQSQPIRVGIVERDFLQISNTVGVTSDSVTSRPGMYSTSDSNVTIDDEYPPTFIGGYDVIGLCTGIEKYSDAYLRGPDGIYIGIKTDWVNNEKHVYKLDKKLVSIDTSTFTYLGSYTAEVNFIAMGTSYAKDKYKVYSDCGKELENASPESFTVLDYGYARDGTNIWYLGEPLVIVTDETMWETQEVVVDYTTFQLLDSPVGAYAKDKNHVFSEGVVIEGADPATFTTVFDIEESLETYGKDANHVYYGTRLIDGAIPENCIPEHIDGCEPSRWKEGLG